MDSSPDQTLETLAAAGRTAAAETSLEGALAALAEAAAQATGADAVVVRVASGGGDLGARHVTARSASLGAELEGSTIPLSELGENGDEERRRAGRGLRASDVRIFPARVAGETAGALELRRSKGSFEPGELVAGRLAASHLGLVLRAFLESNGAARRRASPAGSLALVGDALTAGLDRERIGDDLVRIAAQAAGAEAALLWAAEEGSLELLASSGVAGATTESGEGAERSLSAQEPVQLDTDELGRPVATITLGQPAVGVLELVFPAGSPPAPEELDRLSTFGVRAAQTLRADERARRTALDLERAEALLGVVGQAIAELSLAHTLETAVARVSELVRTDRVAVYLRRGARLRPQDPDTSPAELAVAERLLEVSFGPRRAQGVLHVADAQSDVQLATVRDEVREAEVDAVLAVPLVAREELIGLLAVYLPRGRDLFGNEASLLAALGSQLAVATQNAQLHEQTKRLAVEREEALASEQRTAARDRALRDISSSFAQSLSLDKTLDAVAKAAVELLQADAAVVRTEDERGTELIPRATYVADQRLAEPLKPLLTRNQAVDKLPGRRLFRMAKPLVLDTASARRLGSSYELLVPFLEQGSTAVIVPIETQVEWLATLTVVSLDPDRRIGENAAEIARSVASQAGLAIDNARLYQHQKDFLDTMQRLLLPQRLPEVPGLEVGRVYQSSARVDVGGDVYDFLTLPDGTLAIVLGDASGHGVAATADMALAKFAFRSLVRQFPDPGDLLAQVNEVALGELVGETFVTMMCVTVDPRTGEVGAASAGHPAARILAADGAVTQLAPRGLALGVEADQHYERVTATLEPGAALCLYTDGLVEARHDGELYGDERLDRALAAGRELPAQELAEHVVADARAFAGEPGDDYAVVVIRRLEHLNG